MLKINKTQKEIEELAGRVPMLTDAQKKWAIGNFNYFVCVAQGKTEIRCPNCKLHTEYINVPHKQARWNKNDYTITCPHCGATIQVRVNDSSYKAKPITHQEDFFQVMSVVGEWQVTRLFYMDRYTYVKKPSTDWSFWEVCQSWNSPKYTRTFFRAFPKKMMMGYHFNPYKLFSWEIRYEEDGKTAIRDEQGYYVCDTKMNTLEPRRIGGSNYFETKSIAPGARILPAYKRMGLSARVLRSLSSEYNAMWLMECFSGDNYKPLYETLLKEREYKLFCHVADRHNRDNAEEYFSAWKICKRNGFNYKKEFTEWVDLVDMLIETQMDYRSPHYVCPDNIHEMHQRVLSAKKRKEKEIELERKAEENKHYEQRIAKYLDMDIHNDDLTIIVLPNIKAFMEEGDHLGHCVYRCGYYNKVDSLILSAREGNKRWETIEVNLRTFKILQCYGYKDKHTERHKEIIDLVMKNMWQIKERRDGKKMKKVA